LLRSRWHVVALVLATALALAYAAAALAPPKYVATGAVLLRAKTELLVPASSEVALNAHSGSRMIRIEYASSDPRHAASVVNEFLRNQRDPVLVDEARVVRAAAGFARNLGVGAVFGLVVSLLVLWRPRRSALRSEKELIAVLGEPLLAARPLAAQGVSQQLMAHWFGRGRPVLAVVSADRGDGRTRVAAELARAFARSGEPTLLIDADLRSPGLHREFGLRNRAGLADFLEGRAVRLAQCADNLAVLVAGRSSADSLELLSRGRLQHLLAAAAKRYRVVLVDTPAATRGPDLQLFAAFAGGALVVSRFSTEIPALERLRDFLAHCRARVVGTILSPA
jgi:Mrp family chromosome partitioning ATPase